jgi:hypothetical protein
MSSRSDSLIATVVPPEHPARRRVRLIIVANREGDIGSAFVFSDDPSDPITSAMGSGTLSDKLSEAMQRLELVQSLPLNNPGANLK